MTELNTITTLLIILGATTFAAAPILAVLWWGDRISH